MLKEGGDADEYISSLIFNDSFCNTYRVNPEFQDKKITTCLITLDG
ncbi:MAG: hypothetical protein LKJ25_09235 [Clostridia bacterium]|nr:hypothetical protein [Clostridia bacterium]